MLISSRMQHFARLILVVTIILLSLLSCNKVYDDKIPPTLILQGPNPMRMFTGCDFSDPGFILTDDLTPESQLEVNIYDSAINTSKPGNYYVDYYATDLDGNTAYARRKVEVLNFSLNYYNAVFEANDTLKPMNIVSKYNVTSQLFSQEFRWIKLFNFNNWGSNFNVLMIPDTLGNLTLSYSLNDTLITGTGSTFCNMTGFRLDYQVETPSNGLEVHTATYKFKAK